MRSFFLILLVAVSGLFSCPSFAEQTSPLDLKDLGFTARETQTNPEQSLILEKRTQMLQRHQLMGYTTAALVLATMLAAPGDGQSASSTHMGLAAVAEASYAYAAYLSLSSPEIAGLEKTGYGAKIHRALVWIHLPAMALLPFAGIDAQRARTNGQDPTGLGAYHKSLGKIAVASILASAISMTIEF